MIELVINIACLLLGTAIGYILIKRKSDSWISQLTNAVLRMEGNKKISHTKEYLSLPNELKPIILGIESQLSSIDKNDIAKEAITSTILVEDVSKKQLNNMLIINELGQKITSSLLLEETFKHLYTTLNSMMDAAVVELGVYTSEIEKWTTYSNLVPKSTSEYQNNVAIWVQANYKMVELSNVESDYGRYVNEPLKVQNGELAKSLLSFPIAYKEKVVAVLTVVSFRVNAFDEYHKYSIEHLLDFISVALQNAYIHEQVNLLKIRAEESEKHEQQFLANMSHEIRTPMNAVLGMTNLLLDTKLEEKQLKYLKAINISSKNLLVIINDVLDLSKLEAGKMEIEKIPFRIHEVIQNVSDTNRFKAEEKGLRFEINISPDLPDVVKGDPTRLNQILTNLCSNAIKFTEKGKISINVDKPSHSNFIQFRVIDTGIGIPNDKLHLLFGNFKQVDSSTFRKYGGTGLGLAISKTLIELQGGKVDVQSTIGKGSEFVVKIPYEVGSEVEALQMNQVKSIDYAGLNGIRILVAEDNEYNQIVVNDTLLSLIANVQIDLAENGFIAVEKCKLNIYDLILMDAQMPEMDGLEATRIIRNLPDLTKKNIPIIALTASVHRADIDKCMDSGMNAFVPKPFTREELIGTISSFFHNPNEVLREQVLTDDLTSDSHELPEMPSNKESVTDLTFLRKFTEDDAVRMRKYIGLYLKLLPDNLDKLDLAINANDFTSLVSVLHAMRPHLNYMGMKISAIIAAEIESNVHHQTQLNKINEMVETIRKHCLLSKYELQEVLNNLP